MPGIHITTFIAAPPEVVFELSRHIGLYQVSQQKHKEEAVAGVTNGLIQKGESVTWKARHLFKTRYLKIRIEEMKPFSFFEDKMEEGDFKLFRHQHHFKQAQNGTLMIDELEFESPYGIIGQILNRLYLTNYLKELLLKRNEVIKEYAESKKWEVLLNN